MLSARSSLFHCSRPLSRPTSSPATHHDLNHPTVPTSIDLFLYTINPLPEHGSGSTWGDWGPDDQLGRLNLLDESTTLTAAKEIKDGKRFCLCLPLDLPGGEVLSPGRPPPKLKPTGAVDQPLFNMWVIGIWWSASLC